MSQPIPFAVIGAGWRAEFFFRVAQACPDLFDIVGVVTNNADRIKLVQNVFGFKAYPSIENLLKNHKPNFVVTSVPRTANPQILVDLHKQKMPVLTETPPAGTIDALVKLWHDLGPGAKVQVAEQVHLQPHHAARLALAASGKLGPVNQTFVSVAHGYHGISLMRKALGIGFEPCTITSCNFASKIIEGPGRDGGPQRENITNSWGQVATFNFGEKLGLYEFCFDQYFSPIRVQRFMLRGQLGEIVDDQARYMKDYRTPITLDFQRHQQGPDGTLEGNFLKGIQLGEDWLFTNPYQPVRLTDDEIAVAECLTRMDRFVQTGESFYSLAEGCQDTYLDLLSAQAAESGQAITSAAQPWAS